MHPSNHQGGEQAGRHPQLKPDVRRSPPRRQQGHRQGVTRGTPAQTERHINPYGGRSSAVVLPDRTIFQDG